MDRPGPDWFNSNLAEQAFTRHLLPLAGQEHFAVLQIGAYCGDASEWLLKNILTGFGSWLVDVDTWEGSDEEPHHEIDWNEVLDFYGNRLSAYRNHGMYVGTSDSYFEMKPAPFDFIYVDGDHRSEQVLRDAVNADRYIKVGGIIAFDDYQWSGWGDSRDVPGPAVDAFLRCYEKRYEVLEIGWQVWVRRVR